MQVKKQQLEPDMEQHTGSKLGKECIKAGYCHLAYLTHKQSQMGIPRMQVLVGKKQKIFYEEM